MSERVITLAERLPAEFYLDEGCYVVEMADAATDPTLSIARCRVAPNCETQWHKLSGTVERYLIASGEGIVFVGAIEQAVVAGDVVIIPADCPQRIRNTSASDDLIFHAMCTPRFEPACYQACEAP